MPHFFLRGHWHTLLSVMFYVIYYVICWYDLLANRIHLKYLNKVGKKDKVNWNQLEDKKYIRLWDGFGSVTVFFLRVYLHFFLFLKIINCYIHHHSQVTLTYFIWLNIINKLSTGISKYFKKRFLDLMLSMI